MTERKLSRRDFLKLAGATIAGAALGFVGDRLISAVSTSDQSTLTPTPTLETPTPTPTATATATATPPETPTAAPETPGEVSEKFNFTPAQKSGDKWVLHTSDGNPVALPLPEGYTPDNTLKISNDVHPQHLLPVPKNAAEFQQYLNNPQDPKGALAGFTVSVNDYNQYYNHKSGPQLPAYSWEVFTGLVVNIPGIGLVKGGQGRAAMVLVINRTDKVYRWPTNSVHVEAGFQGWGRIWNGDADHTTEAEKRLAQHFLTRLGQGVPETGFIGQCDQGARNCDEVTVVSVERIQWGNNPDGSPQYQFRLIRAETVPAPK